MTVPRNVTLIDRFAVEDESEPTTSGKVKVDTSRRIYINVWDVDGHLLRQIPMPFGLVDIVEPHGGYPAVLRFGLMMIERHHPNLAVIDSRDATDTEDAAVMVADRGPQ